MGKFAENLNLGKRVRPPLKITFKVLLFEFCTFLPVSKLMYVFAQGQGIHFLKFWQNWAFHFQKKKKFYVILGCKGAFVDSRKTFCSFEVILTIWAPNSF